MIVVFICQEVREIIEAEHHLLIFINRTLKGIWVAVCSRKSKRRKE
jgi:hypothetical protein